MRNSHTKLNRIRVSNLKKKIVYSRHCFVAKAVLRGVGATMIRGVTLARSTLDANVRPGADTQARKSDQTDQRSLHVA